MLLANLVSATAKAFDTHVLPREMYLHLDKNVPFFRSNDLARADIDLCLLEAAENIRKTPGSSHLLDRFLCHMQTPGNYYRERLLSHLHDAAHLRCTEGSWIEHAQGVKDDVISSARAAARDGVEDVFSRFRRELNSTRTLPPMQMTLVVEDTLGKLEDVVVDLSLEQFTNAVEKAANDFLAKAIEKTTLLEKRARDRSLLPNQLDALLSRVQSIYGGLRNKAGELRCDRTCPTCGTPCNRPIGHVNKCDTTHQPLGLVGVSCKHDDTIIAGC
jgi:hypothetical protein